MKNWILPTVIESAVEATKTHEIEIKLALTSFLTLKIENFIFELEQKKRSSAKPSLMFSENKILTTLVKNLKIVIDLEQCTTQPELRNKIAEIDAPKKRNLLDEKIETEILNGIKHGFHLLCDYLNKTAKSHELTARLLALSCIPFSIKNENPNESINLFNDAIEKLEKDKVENLANAIIESARSKYESTIPENEKNIAEQIFKEARIIIKTTFFRLQEICKQMIDKINHSAQAPLDPENNVQQEITKFLTILKIFANREEFHKKMKELDPSDQGRIWHELDPVFDRAIKLEKSILALQETESNHHKHAKVVNQLKSVKIFFETLIHTFPKQPRHMRNSVKPTLEKFCEEMTRYLGRPKAPIVIKLKEPIPLLSKLSEKIANEQQVLDALNDLFSLPEDSQPMTKLGLLNQLFNYKFSEPPQGFKLKTNLADIDKCVDSFPDKEKKELRALIGDGSNLLETCGPWDSLFEMIHRIRQDHSQTKQEDLDEWNKTLREMVDWVEKKGEGYMFLKIEDHKKMEDTIKTVSSEIEEFRNKGLPMQLNPPLHLTQNHIKMGLAATAVATGAFGLVGWATALTAAAASAKADVIIPAVIQAKVLPKVKEFFKNASTLCFSPRIYKAGTTRILKAIAK